MHTIRALKMKIAGNETMKMIRNRLFEHYELDRTTYVIATVSNNKIARLASQYDTWDQALDISATGDEAEKKGAKLVLYQLPEFTDTNKSEKELPFNDAAQISED